MPDTPPGPPPRTGASRQLWLDDKPFGRSGGRWWWAYAVWAICMAAIYVMLLFADWILVRPGLTGIGNSLNVGYDPGGALAVALFGLLIAAAGVLWPVGILQQAVFGAILVVRSFRAPKGAVISTLNLGPIAFGGTMEPAVGSPFSRWWMAVGNMGWLPDGVMFIGAYLIGVAFSIMSTANDWYYDGAPMAGVYTLVIGLVVVGLVALVAGARTRFPEYLARAEAADAKIDKERLARHRSQQYEYRRRLKLTQAQRDAEDVALATEMQRITDSVKRSMKDA